jgi:hypothetical protein
MDKWKLLGMAGPGNGGPYRHPKTSETADGHLKILYPYSFRQAGRSHFDPMNYIRPDYERILMHLSVEI